MFTSKEAMPEIKPSILVVDDTPENIDVLKETLKGDYTVRPALNGELALRIAGSDPRPELILLDIMMPGMDGYEVMRRLQANAATRDIPVIFVTAISDMEGELKGFELGAADYITKPFNPPIVKARVQTHLALRKAKINLEQKNSILLYEREIVEDIITRMRTSQYFDDKQLRYLISSVDRTNGDILLAARTPDGQQRVLVGDVTGHGLPAAVAAPLISYVFYNQTLTGKPIENTLNEINDVMCRQLPVNIFMTGCLVEISDKRNQIRLWNSGVPTCVLMRDGNIVGRMISRALPFGISTQMDFSAAQETWEAKANDRLYIFTDGVTEVAAPSGEQFGAERIEDFLKELYSANKAPVDLLHVLEQFHCDSEFSDDITLVEIQI